jgi:hypothetical protein
MNLGRIKKVYSLYRVDKRILDTIQTNLKEKNVDEMHVDGSFISFRNNYIGKRSNISLMSGIDSGYFKLIEKNNCNQLIVMFSIKRLLLFWIIMSFIILAVDFENIIDALLISVFLLSMILVSILRYYIFVNKIIKEFQNKK